MRKQSSSNLRGPAAAAATTNPDSDAFNLPDRIQSNHSASSSKHLSAPLPNMFLHDYTYTLTEADYCSPYYSQSPKKEEAAPSAKAPLSISHQRALNTPLSEIFPSMAAASSRSPYCYAMPHNAPPLSALMKRVDNVLEYCEGTLKSNVAKVDERKALEMGSAKEVEHKPLTR